MANPQIENGYTKIANELLEAICNRLTNSTWIRLLVLTARLTYGWNRKECESYYNSYATKLNLTRDTVRYTLQDLHDRHIVKYVNLTTEKFLISINKDYEKWKIEK